MPIQSFLLLVQKIIWLLICFAISDIAQAQYWQEDGTEWTYTQIEYFSPDFYPVSIKLGGDVFIGGRDCKIIEGTCNCSYIAEGESLNFIYEENGMIYYYHLFEDEFYLLYDFNAGAGDSWELYIDDLYGYLTINVDSISTEVIDGNSIEIQHISYNNDYNGVQFGPKIYRGIGSEGCLFPYFGGCDPATGGFRCYDSPSTGTINFNDGIPCDTAYYFVPELLENIDGYVFEDFDFDCKKDDFENLGHLGWTVKIENLVNSNAPVYEQETNEDGYYSFTELEDYYSDEAIRISFIKPDGSDQMCCSHCESVRNVGLFENLDLTINHGIFCELDAICSLPIMDVAIATNWIRPCFDGKYWVNYCNIGCETAEDAFLQVQIDPGLTIVESSIPWTDQAGQLLTYDLGNVESGECERFSITFNAPCTEPTGATYCSDVYAYPDSTCVTNAWQWDGSQIELSGVCLGDSIQFTIENVGDKNMSKAAEYIIIEDNVLYPPAIFQLTVGEILTITLPVNGYYYSIIALQPDGFPTGETPTFWIEGCDEMAEVTVGLVNQFSLGDEDPWYDVYCRESVNSFDPNDKTGYPSGVGPTHWINQNVPLDYVIRFENTGTAPAYDIEIRDTIPLEFLDPASVRPGASSHPYTWDMQGDGVVVFKFQNIDLPDSTSDPDGAQGFVQFKVNQFPDLPIGTAILNTAAIYFDNNAPIITNQTLHTIGEDIFTKTSEFQNVNAITNAVEVIPNPFQEQFKIHLPEHPTSEKIKLEIYDAFGKNLMSTTIKNGASIFSSKNWTPGIYFFKCTTTTNQVATGKLIKIPLH